MKNRGGTIFCVILLLCLACSLVFVMFLGILHTDIRNFRISASPSDRLALEKEFSYAELQTINTDSDAADIKLISSTDADKVAVKIYASENKNVRAENDSGKLDISIKDSCRWFCLNFEVDRIEISLPEQYAGEFNIKSDAGKITSDSFSRASYTINSDAGDINIPAAKKLTIDSDAGKIELGSIESIYIENDAGDIKINECFGSLEIKSDAGKIDIDELQLSQDSSIKSDAGKIHINNAGNARIETEGDLTEFNIKNNRSDSDIVLKIKVDAGMVEVDS